MTQSEIYAALTDIMRDVLMQDDLVLTPQLRAADVEGWDSFKMIEIVISLESSLGVTIRSRDLDRVHCVGDLVACVQRQQSPQLTMQ